MDDSTVDEPVFPGAESDSHHGVLALFKQINTAAQKGMLIWTLKKKVEADPSSSVSLVRLLVTELEKTQQEVGKASISTCDMSIMSALHMLYFIIQSGFTIPRSLYHRACRCLTQLLVIPLPYSAVALKTLRNINKEMMTPGSLYLMRVIAEQNIKNKHYHLQEQVIVLADPAVFPASSETTLRVHLDGSGLPRNTPTAERKIVLHMLQSALETFGQRTKLAQALEAFDEDVVRKYFHDVILAVSQSVTFGAGNRANYLNTLQEIHRDIMTAAEKVVLETTESGPGSLCITSMPYPEINFFLWKDEEDLWNLLTKFTLQANDEEEGNKRDSGIEKDINEPSEPIQPPDTGSDIQRRNAYKRSKSVEKLSLVKDKIDGCSGGSVELEERSHTARVIVLGDNRVLGRLARAYCSMREKESKRNVLTKKLNLQLYYIPVCDVKPSFQAQDSLFMDDSRLSLASHLGRVDPWYHSDISSLGTAISTLSEMPTKEEPSELGIFLLDSLCDYLRCGSQPVNLPLYSVKMVSSSSGVSSEVKDVFVSHLEANIPDFRHLKKTLSEKAFLHRKSKSKSKKQGGANLSVVYTKTSLSKRQSEVGDASITSGFEITSEPATSTSADDYLAVSFNRLNPKNNSVSLNTSQLIATDSSLKDAVPKHFFWWPQKIHTKSITIKTLEHWTLSVCLDRDARRTYDNIQKIQISPCLDPGCNIQSRFGPRGSQELPLGKYVDKVLSLPINTFNGASV